MTPRVLGTYNELEVIELREDFIVVIETRPLQGIMRSYETYPENIGAKIIFSGTLKRLMENFGSLPDFHPHFMNQVIVAYWSKKKIVVEMELTVGDLFQLTKDVRCTNLIHSPLMDALEKVEYPKLVKDGTKPSDWNWSNSKIK